MFKDKFNGSLIECWISVHALLNFCISSVEWVIQIQLENAFPEGNTSAWNAKVKKGRRKERRVKEGKKWRKERRVEEGNNKRKKSERIKEERKEEWNKERRVEEGKKSGRRKEEKKEEWRRKEEKKEEWKKERRKERRVK